MAINNETPNVYSALAINIEQQEKCVLDLSKYRNMTLAALDAANRLHLAIGETMVIADCYGQIFMEVSQPTCFDDVAVKYI